MVSAGPVRPRPLVLFFLPSPPKSGYRCFGIIKLIAFLVFVPA